METDPAPALEHQTVRLDLKGWGCKNPVWRKDGSGPDLGEKRERAMSEHITAALAEHTAQGWRATHDVSYLGLLPDGRLHWEVRHSVLGLTSQRLDFMWVDVELIRP